MPANLGKKGVRLLLTPELSAAEDLFLRPAFVDACDDAVKVIVDAPADLKDMRWVRNQTG